MPRFAANLSMLFTEVPLLDRFARARDAGFSAVEIQFPYELGIAALDRAIRDAGVELVLFNVPAADLLAGGDGLACVRGREAEFRDAVDRAATYASALSPRGVNILAGRVPEGASADSCRAVFAENLAFAAEVLGELGVVPLVEALNPFDVPRFLVSSIDAVLAAIDDAGAKAKAQYDVYHAARIGADVLAELRIHATRIGHVQVADLPGRTAPGTGTLDFDAIFRTIDAQLRDVVVGAEYKTNGPTEPTLGWLRAYSVARR